MAKPLQFSAIAVAMAFSLGGAHAQSTAPSTSSGDSSARTAPAAQPGTGTRNTESKKDDKVARGDRKFIQEAAESGMAEVQAAKLASAKASDPEVKKFAEMLVEQHTRSNEELAQLAKSKAIELPATAPRAQRKEVEDLGKKTGAEFDRQFVREVGIKDHEKDIKKFQNASKDVKDPELKAYVTKTLPVLQEHLAQAKQLPQAGGEKMGGSAAGDTARMGAGGSGKSSAPAAGSGSRY
ncbi:DUF4142 domain-containing protein [Ramlibacter tataouinensis]|uniref:DUF4142 domain-containing protein n=1 Tax=Ramlibacter tataouinensis TaxID=94132 RepID=UPI0022F39A5E|nr:DUF4142 domain-containing protein [Ramlibacter tataouinensis]WBY02586.1 DUF4142 domain-containing protein [Ramlibacter tataouinensis]